MNNDDLKYLFEQMLDFIPKDCHYFNNMVKLTKIFKDIEDKIEVDEVEDIRKEVEDYWSKVPKEDGGYKAYFDSDSIKCSCTLDDAVAKVIKQFTIDPQFKINQKNNIANCVIEEVDSYLSTSKRSTAGLNNAIKLGASKYINELIDRVNPEYKIEAL